MSNDDIIVVGAGIGGLSAAIRLAYRGYAVHVVEKNRRVGGKMSEHSAEGYRWDTGPSVITMRHVFEALFNSVGRQLDDYLTLVPVDPLTRYFYPDGSMLDAKADVDTMAQLIAQFNPDDVAGYKRLLASAAELHRVTGPVFIYDQPPTPASFLRVPVRDWFKVNAWRSMQADIDRHVQSEQLRLLFGRFATYVGGSPFAAPATLNVIADVEMNGGVWYPQGGIYQIADALGRLARELGVKIDCNSPVDHITTQNGRATGVALASGEALQAKAVLSNVDVSTTFEQLLPAHTASYRRRQRLLRTQPSCSGFILMLGVEATHETLAHHNIWFSADYKAEFDAIFNKGVPAQDPTIYAAITSKRDPAHAPPGCENWFILVNAPATHTDGRWDWQTQSDSYRDLILQRLADRGIELRDKIKVEQRLTPHDVADMTGAHRGALYGASPNSMWSAFLRPHNQNRRVPGLFFAGGTTHPGGGVPMVTLSGKVAADRIVSWLSQ